MSSQLLLHEAAGWHWWFARSGSSSWVVVDRHDRAVRALASARALRPARRRPRILAERYARGEIDAEEYAARLEVLGQ